MKNSKKIFLVLSLSASSLCFGMDTEDGNENTKIVIENKCNNMSCPNYEHLQEHSWPQWMEEFKKEPESGFRFQSKYTLKHGSLLACMQKLAQFENITQDIKLKAIPCLDPTNDKNIKIVSYNTNVGYQANLRETLVDLTIHAKVTQKKNPTHRFIEKTIFGWKFIVEKQITNKDESDTSDNVDTATEL